MASIFVSGSDKWRQTKVRVLPRLSMPKPKSIRRLNRQIKRHLSPRRIFYFSESLVLLTVFVLIFSGSRIRFIDGFGRRSDLIVALLLVAAAIPLHFFARRRLLPRIERRYNPAPYDEHKIFFDLGQGTRTVSSIDQLYENLADKIREAFESSNAAIFVHDELAGDYNLRVLSAPGEPKTKANATKRLSLGSRAFVVRRLMNLSTPLTLEPHDVDTWEQALNSMLPLLRETRANEHDVLKQVKSRLLVQIRQKDELVGILSLGPRRGEFQYSPSDRELLMSIAAQLGLVIENARLTERMVAQERLRRELALAAEVQQR